MEAGNLATTNKLVDDIEMQGVVRVLNSNFHELIALGPSAERNVCKVLRDYFMSRFGLEYLTKLNSLAKRRFVHSEKDERDRIYRWINNDVMERFNEVCETDIFDSPRSLSALLDIILALHSSTNVINEEDIEEEMEYIFDIPYRLGEMVHESSHIPKFYTHSFRHEEINWSERANLKVSDSSVSVSYQMDLKR